MWNSFEMPFFHSFGMIFFWLIFIAVIVLVIKASIKNNKTAMDILDERLAKGKITKEEYNELKKKLEE